MRRPGESLTFAAALLRSRLVSPAWRSTQPSPRLFTSNHPQLLLVSSHGPRPQLDYLSQSNVYRRDPLLHRAITRLLSTETKQYVREQTALALKWGFGGLAVIFLLTFAGLTWRSEQLERIHPSPPDWSYLTRVAFRAAYLTANDDAEEMLAPSWGPIGNNFRQALLRLEDPETDGKGLKSLSAIGIEAYPVVRRIGPACFDFTGKSEAWKAGYVDVVMHLAEAAENLQDFVHDWTQDKVFPKSTVVGPSNPHPRKLLAGGKAPQEANCAVAYPDPAVLYNRIALSVGFSIRQRIGAMHALANWLYLNGDIAAAGEQYAYAVAVASDVARTTEFVQNNLDSIDTLKDCPATASLNLLNAWTQQASFLARTGRASEALPIYLACLQAIRQGTTQAAAVPTTNAGTNASAVAPPPRGPFSTLAKTIKFRPDVYPLPFRTGDEPLADFSASELSCSEAELMLYIGEILFASSPSKQDEGVGWTRAAANKSLDALRASKQYAAARQLSIKQGTTSEDASLQWRTRDRHESERQLQCKQCLRTGLLNWDEMARLMLPRPGDRGSAENSGWLSWLGAGGGHQANAAARGDDHLKALEEMNLALLDEGIISHRSVMPT